MCPLRSTPNSRSPSRYLCIFSSISVTRVSALYNRSLFSSHAMCISLMRTANKARASGCAASARESVP
uniref:Uncharacterized protein n=1 Tax=Parascaris equorum TaxID=6256 RepID=A0A914RP45_PAREQ